MVAKHVNTKMANRGRVLAVNAPLLSLSALAVTFYFSDMAFTFNDGKPPPKAFCANLM